MEFGAKVRVVRDPNPETRFLFYIPSGRPADADNWLLDLLLQGYEYKADKASLILQEVGLPHEFRYVAEEHAAFFQNAKRLNALKDLIANEDNAADLRLKMMAVLAGADVDLDALLLQFLARSAEAGLIDPVAACLESAGLLKYFWTEVHRIFGYVSSTPTLKDFAVSLFRGANPLDDQVSLHPHGKVFLQRWKDSQEHSASFRRWSRQLERELQISDALNRMRDNVRLFFQARNLMEFLQMVHHLVPEGDEVSVHLVTQSDRNTCEKQAEHLNQMVEAFTGSKVAFTWELDHSPNFHARSITTDTGWKITIDRGLDIFQKFDTGPFSLEQAIQEARLTRGAEITYLKA